MIERISLHNVQAIKDVSLELGKVTVIVGETDTGKSSIVRGLHAFLVNDYSSELLRSGTKKMKVGLEVEGHKIWFEKGSVNKYFLDNEPFAKIGKDIPQKIKDIIKLRSIKFAKDVQFFLAVQTQHQGHFLVEDYGGVTSKVIGKLSNLGIIYNAIRASVADQKKVKAQLDSAIDQRNNSGKVKEALELFRPLEKINIVAAGFKEIEKVEATLSNIEVVLTFAKSNQRFQAISTKVDEVIQLVADTKVKKSQLQAVILALGLACELKILSDRIVALDFTTVLEKLEQAETHQKSIVLVESALCANIQHVQQQQEFSAIVNQLKVAKKELSEAIEEFSICPTCLQLLSAEAKERLLNA